MQKFFLKLLIPTLFLIFTPFAIAQTSNGLNSLMMGPPNPPQQFVVGEPDTPAESVSSNDNSNTAAPVNPPPPPPAVTTPAPPVPAIGTPNLYQTYPSAPGYQPPPAVTPSIAPTYQTPSNATPSLNGPPPPTAVISINPGSGTQPTTVQLAPPFPGPKLQIEASPPTAPTYQPPPVGTAITPPIPLPTQTIQGPPYHDFQGGLDSRNFIQCEKMGASVCSQAQVDAGFQQCILRLRQQAACNQFVSFAVLSQFNIKDDIDFMQHYNEGQLDLVHVIRGDLPNYPGDYFVLTVNGDVININSGRETQSLDITRDPQYALIAQRFPKAGLWSIIDQTPQTQPLPAGGIRMVFRFRLLNGCPTCELAGYAYVAYDFSQIGALTQVLLISLQPAGA